MNLQTSYTNKFHKAKSIEDALETVIIGNFDTVKLSQSKTGQEQKYYVRIYIDHI